MKKLIVILFLGISFVGLILISFMKYQTTLFIENSPGISSYQNEYPMPFHTEKVWYLGL